MSKKHEVRSTLQKQKLLFTEFVDLLHLGITFLFHQRAFGNFLFRRRDRFVCRCWLGVPICIHSRDRISLI